MKYFLLALLILVLIFFGLGFWYFLQLQPVSSQTDKISFVVSKSESGDSILSRLQTAGLIRSALASKLFLRLNNLSSRLKPGGYILTSDLSTSQILAILVSGPKDIRVTIPEGWRREQIAARLASILSGPNSLFDPMEFIRQTATLEGRLFPDTYFVSPQASSGDVIKLFTSNFNKKTGLNVLDQPAKEMLIIASLVEREVKFDSERATIAGILIKRYEAGWPLQVDASVQYAADSYNCRNRLLTCEWWSPLTDTQFLSAYNTYLHPGLPPTPISNPGLASINAAKNQENARTPYWYYLHDTQGKVHLAVTLAEHQANIDKYLKP